MREKLNIIHHFKPLALHVRVDGQSSNDTVGKNGSHWLEVLRNKALLISKICLTISENTIII